MTTYEPDEFDLELQAAGAEVRPEVARALADPAFDPARQEIEKLGAWWATHRPPLPEAGPRGAPRRSWPRQWGWVAPLLVAAAAVLLVVAWPSDPGFQARGVPTVDVLRVRDGAPVDARELVLPGDQLGLSLVVDAPRYVSVFALQEDGQIAVLVRGQQVSAGQRFSVPGRIALDDYAGREWLVVEASESRPDERALRTGARELLPEPAAHAGADRWVIEVTRGRSVR